MILRGGIYYLPEPLVFKAEDSGTASSPVIYQPYQDEQPVLSGGVRLQNLNWRPYTSGIYQTRVPDDLQTEELFVNGERQILARYPNFNPNAQYFDGFAADAFSTSGSRAGRILLADTSMPCILPSGAISPGELPADTQR